MPFDGGNGAAVMPSAEDFSRVVIRLLIAVILGALIGWERERHHHWAGLRTHMLITLSSAAFMLLAVEISASAGGHSDPLRVLQGIAIGVGFIGAGTILKNAEKRMVHGLTTASGIWLASAIGVAAGAGWITVALVTTMFDLAIVWGLGAAEKKWNWKSHESK
jgi:putative Mg2+ transporter-C (MgtC) family protein